VTKEAALTPGTQVTKGITLVQPLGAGGMGAVWLADHAGLQTRVVVKFMLSGLDQSTQARSRFSREAAAAALVKSPHVVQMLDHGVTDDGVPFIVMEHLEGQSLGQAMDKQGRLAQADVVAIVTQVAKALSRVHGAGLLHRDIKPDNIFLCAGEDEIFVKLLDFGIVKTSANEQVDSQTKTGQVVGTPFYMSPEQVNAEKTIDARSDLWALAVVAYEALTARKPFDGPSFGALAVSIVTTTAPKPSQYNPELSSAVDAWFERALTRDPAKRFGTAKELSEAFRVAFGHTTMPPPSNDSASSLSDSGSGGLSESGRRNPREPTPTELDATVEDSAHSALARSEPAGSKADLNVATSARRGPPATKIALTVVGVAAIGVLVFLAFGHSTEPHGAGLVQEHPTSPTIASDRGSNAVVTPSSLPSSAPSVAASASPSSSASAVAAPASAKGAGKTAVPVTQTPAATASAKAVASAQAAGASPPPSAAPSASTPKRSGNDPLF
jgi:serine/threonine-protein kinase